MNSSRKTAQIAARFISIGRMMSDKKSSSGSAGAIRAGGGAFAKMGVAHEEEYFYKQRQEQLDKLKKKQVEETKFRKKAIKDHEAAIQRHKEAIADTKK